MDAYLRRMYAILLLSRPANVVHPLFLVVIGVIVSGAVYDTVVFYLTLSALALVHSAVTIWNDVEDVVIDRRNHVRTILTDGYISSKAVRWTAYGLLAITGIIAVFLPPLSWGVIALFIILGWMYNAPPFQLSRRPIASMVVLAITYGFLPIIVGASLGGVTLQIVLLAFFYGVSRMSLSLLKDYKDAVGDAQSDKRTFLLVYGHRNVRRLSMTAAIISNAAIIYIIGNYIPEGFIGLYYAVLGALYALTLFWRYKLFVRGSYQELNKVFHRCLYVQLILDGVIVLWLMTS
jgi:geranylgeranylglycerol-phosphate geranylgeranyltransferase